MAKAKQTLVLSGDDLTAAQRIVKQIFINRAYCALCGDFANELELLDSAKPLARLFGVLGDQDSYGDTTLSGKDAKRLRKATRELRDRVEHEITRNWPYIKVDDWERDNIRRAREWTLSLLADIERVEALLAEGAGS
jgi:hypothetical protein